jgi:hypothetical protein
MSSTEEEKKKKKKILFTMILSKSPKFVEKLLQSLSLSLSLWVTVEVEKSEAQRKSLQPNVDDQSKQLCFCL